MSQSKSGFDMSALSRRSFLAAAGTAAAGLALSPIPAFASSATSVPGPGPRGLSFVHTHTLVMNSSTRTVREVRMKRPV